jgi:protein SCO1
MRRPQQSNPARRRVPSTAAAAFMLLLAGLTASATAPATAQDAGADSVTGTDDQGRGEPLPAELADVGVQERLGDQVPLATVFLDENGQETALARYFDGERPVILNLGYMGCPMLCGLVTNGLLEAMNAMQQEAGVDYRVISLSIDHSETPILARAKKQGYLKLYDRPGGAQGWHWLTGREDRIRAVTDAVGFGFAWNDRRQEYAHAAVLIVLSPDGRVMRYLYGIEFDPRTLQLSLVEASQGRTGRTLDRLLLFCFQYDAAAGSYAPVAMNIMKIGAIVTVLVLGVMILALRLREKRARRGS